jgi:hypothetical protein
MEVYEHVSSNTKPWVLCRRNYGQEFWWKPVRADAGEGTGVFRMMSVSCIPFRLFRPSIETSALLARSGFFQVEISIQ